MDPEENPYPGVDGGADEAPDRATALDADGPAQEEPGQSSSGDVITVCLFGAMVLIASVCFVIW